VNQITIGTRVSLTEKRSPALNMLAVCLIAIFFGYWIFSTLWSFPQSIQIYQGADTIRDDFHLTARFIVFGSSALLAFLLRFGPPSLCCFPRNLAPLLRSECVRPHSRSLFPALFAAFAAHFLHDFRNQLGIHGLDCTGQASILPINVP
jgi:hypothetical protein